MQSINNYIDATYLKTAEEARVSKKEDLKIVVSLIREAIALQYKAVIIRPWHVAIAKKMIHDASSKVRVGTVIGFPEGKNSCEQKIEEAKLAIQNGADELDFVCNYTLFQRKDLVAFKSEIIQGTKLVFDHNKTIKWIVEVAALNTTEIIKIATFIKNSIIANFKEEKFESVYIKSSTGYYNTIKSLPNGATKNSIILLLENGSPLPIKASGGIKTYEQATNLIRLGVKRIGTSTAKTIFEEELTSKIRTN